MQPFNLRDWTQQKGISEYPHGPLLGGFASSVIPLLSQGTQSSQIIMLRHHKEIPHETLPKKVLEFLQPKIHEPESCRR